jgi:hypothetical protein
MDATKQRRFALAGALIVIVQAAGVWGQVRHEIRMPDIAGYTTLKCDLHMHTVFSDGLVWPTVRVEEAWREGLDVISITDHIEYQPHKDDIPTNHNRPYEIARRLAEERGILLIRGAEITRDTPPGHFNAIFLEDVNPLDTEDLLDCVAAADKQGAFIFWNHPGWKPDRKGWFEIHTTLYEKKYLRGIEVVNGRTYYPEAHEWALEKDLTFMGTSDIHQPATLERSSPEEHRSMTLVFAKERTVPAVKDAIEAGRTAIWYQYQLIGRKKYLEALFEGATQIENIQYGSNNVIRFALANNCDVPLDLERAGSFGPKELLVPPGSQALLRVKVPSTETPTKLSYIARNFVVAPQKGLPVNFMIAGQLTVNVDLEQSRK